MFLALELGALCSKLYTLHPGLTVVPCTHCPSPLTPPPCLTVAPCTHCPSHPSPPLPSQPSHPSPRPHSGPLHQDQPLPWVWSGHVLPQGERRHSLPGGTRVSERVTSDVSHVTSCVSHKILPTTPPPCPLPLLPSPSLRFNLVGYGCMTCIGNSGPLPDAVVQAVDKVRGEG